MVKKADSLPFNPPPFSWVSVNWIGGAILNGWFVGVNSSGDFLVQVSDDGPARPFLKIFPPKI
jgi:hypothetical protein